LDIQKTLLVEFPDVPEYRFDVAMTHHELGNRLLLPKGQPDEIRNEYQTALEILESLAAELPDVPKYRNALAIVLFWKADWMAKAMVKAGAPVPTVPRLVSVEPLLRRAIAVQEKLSADFPAVVNYRYDLLRSLEFLGNLQLEAQLGKQPPSFEDAEIVLRRAMEVGEKLSAESPTVHYFRSKLTLVYSNLAWIFHTTGRRRDAEDMVRRCIAHREKLIVDFPEVIQPDNFLTHDFYMLGSILNSDGRYEEAIHAWRSATESQTTDFNALDLLADLLTNAPDPKIRRPREAIELAQRATTLLTTMLQETGGKNEDQLGRFWGSLGAAHYRAGDWNAAEEALEKAIKLQADLVRANEWFFLAMTQWQLGRKDDANKSYQKACGYTFYVNRPNDVRLRAEAAALLELPETTP